MKFSIGKRLLLVVGTVFASLPAANANAEAPPLDALLLEKARLLALREQADKAVARRLGAFGIKMSINEIVFYLRSQTANFVITRFSGRCSLGEVRAERLSDEGAQARLFERVRLAHILECGGRESDAGVVDKDVHATGGTTHGVQRCFD